MSYEEEYSKAARKIRLLSALNERKEAYMTNLKADSLEILTELAGEKKVYISDSDLVTMLPSGQEALDVAVWAYMQNEK
jgi:hypothetical protein